MAHFPDIKEVSSIFREIDNFFPFESIFHKKTNHFAICSFRLLESILTLTRLTTEVSTRRIQMPFKLWMLLNSSKSRVSPMWFYLELVKFSFHGRCLCLIMVRRWVMFSMCFRCGTFQIQTQRDISTSLDSLSHWNSSRSLRWERTLM